MLIQLKRGLNFLLTIAISASPMLVLGGVKCDGEKIRGVKVKTPGIVMYTTQSGINRVAGDPGMPVSTDYMLRTLLLAADESLVVEAEYPEGYDCTSNNTQIGAESIYVRSSSEGPD